MKTKLLSVLLSLVGLAASAQTFGLTVTIPIDPNALSGLGTNDYLTNFTLLVSQANNAATSPTNYALMWLVPGSQLQLNATGAFWTARVQADNLAHFYVVSMTNSVGNQSPFSPAAIWLPAPSGKVQATR